MTIKTPEAAHRHLKVTPFNSYGFAIEQGISYLLPGKNQYPVKGGA